MDRMKFHIKNIIIVLLFIAWVLTLITNSYTRRNLNFEPIGYKFVYCAKVDVPNYKRKQAVKELKQLFKIQHFYFEKELDGEMVGYSIPLIRLVVVQVNLDDEEYIMSYAHELMHLQEMSGNETWVTYKAIVKLYESGNEYFKAVAWNEAVGIMAGKFALSDYDCGGQLKEYFSL